MANDSTLEHSETLEKNADSDFQHPRQHPRCFGLSRALTSDAALQRSAEAEKRRHFVEGAERVLRHPPKLLNRCASGTEQLDLCSHATASQSLKSAQTHLP
jgi:hypothetical protein